MKYVLMLLLVTFFAYEANAALCGQSSELACEAANCFWCYRCENGEENTFSQDVCVQSNGDCNYGCSTVCGSECKFNSDCRNNLTDDSCYYSGLCSSCDCNFIRDPCPQNGTVIDGICHYGKRECSTSGCAINKCNLKENQVCDPENGCTTVNGSGVFDEYFTDYTCRDNDVWAKKTVYYCNATGCLYSKTDALVEKCNQTCTEGKCDSNICYMNGLNFDCNIRDGFYGDRYCAGNDVYKAYRDYSCSSDECVYNEEQRLLETCEGCENGNCVDYDYQITVVETPPENNNIPADEIIEESDTFSHPGGSVYNGLLFGSGDVVVGAKAGGTISFTVARTNRLGGLTVEKDGNVLFAGRETGSYSAKFSGAGTIRFHTESSWLFIFAPALYEIKQISIAYD